MVCVEPNTPAQHAVSSECSRAARSCFTAAETQLSIRFHNPMEVASKPKETRRTLHNSRPALDQMPAHQSLPKSKIMAFHWKVKIAASTASINQAQRHLEGPTLHSIAQLAREWEAFGTHVHVNFGCFHLAWFVHGSLSESRIEKLVVARNTHLDICPSAQDAWPWAEKERCAGRCRAL